MNSNMKSAQTLSRNVVTVRQQLNNLKTLLEKRQNESLKNKYNDCKENIEPTNHKIDAEPTPQNDVESVQIRSRHTDFQSLLDQKLTEETPEEIAKIDRVIEKRPFLRKGEGLMRFGMKPNVFKLKKRKSLEYPDSNRSQKIPDNVDARPKGIYSPLTEFELLEQKLNDSSFCSTSSLLTQLMEDSVDSTPKEKKTVTELESHSNQLRNLDIIDEEPSKTDYLYSDSDEIRQNREIILVDPSGNDQFSESESDISECTSNCSCQDVTNFMSTSVSVFAEETSVFSPAKSETSRTFRAQFNKAAYNVIGSNENSNEEELNSVLETRTQKLQAEIEAFKIENSHLSKLRKDYEKEYSAFCDERMQLLSKIREDRLKGATELEEGKKKLKSEKIAFEKYMKDVKARPSKQEREEIRFLKEEIALMKEEMNKKESRWGSAQARIRTEMKMLKDHNKTLQEELKELKKTNKKVTFAPVLKKSKSSPSINNKKDENVTKLEVPQHNDADKIIHSILSRSQITSDPKHDSYSLSDSRSFTDTSCDLSEDFRRSVCIDRYLNEDKENFSSYPKDDSGIHESTDTNGNREKVHADGRKEIWCKNGSVKKVSADGQIVKIIYYNGDVEEILTGKQVKYYYASSKTWHTTFSDGRDIKEIKEFPNGQVEKFFHDGSMEIISPDGTVCKSTLTGETKWNLVDGTIIMENTLKSDKRTIFPNGEIEIHTKDFKRREYPNGIVKIVYEIDGRQETRYPNGRIRVKDKNGQLISDTEVT